MALWPLVQRAIAGAPLSSKTISRSHPPPGFWRDRFRMAAMPWVEVIWVEECVHEGVGTILKDPVLLSRGKQHLGRACRQGQEGGIRAQTGFGNVVKSEHSSHRCSSLWSRAPHIYVSPAVKQRALLSWRGEENSSKDSFFTLDMIIWFWVHMVGGTSALRGAFTRLNWLGPYGCECREEISLQEHCHPPPRWSNESDRCCCASIQYGSQ